MAMAISAQFVYTVTLRPPFSYLLPIVLPAPSRRLHRHRHRHRRRRHRHRHRRRRRCRRRRYSAMAAPPSQPLPLAPDVVSGTCYCAGMKFTVDCTRVAPRKSLYCHCESCRRAHAAPVYQVVYGTLRKRALFTSTLLSAISCSSLSEKPPRLKRILRLAPAASAPPPPPRSAVAPECMKIVSGEELLERYQKTEGSIIRAFCRGCGSRVQNIIPGGELVGFFPALLDEETQHNLAEAFRPNFHYLPHEAVVKVDMFPALPDPDYCTPMPAPAAE